jgi:hypothetical protein
MSETRPEFHNALHHAGHAVVAHVVGLPFGHASLDEDPESLGHLLHGGDPSANRKPDERARLAAVSVAGPLALERHGGTVPVDAEIGAADRWVARADATEARATAGRILEACWPAVTAVADLLIARERVTATDVASAVRSAAPEMERAVPYVEHGVAAVRRPSGAADSEDHAAAMPDGALVGGVEEGGGD